MNIVLGTMTFGMKVNYDESKEILNLFFSKGYNEIDTAYVYNEGNSEIYIGKALKVLDDYLIKVATKVNPRITGYLNKDGINFQLNESLKRMKISSVNILYLHFPDARTPLEETLEACSELYNSGKFLELGLSNFSALEVEQICELCNKNNWVKPTVYQGMYNILSRKIESELFPVLRKFGIRFYAYNPLAGGILTGKYLNYKEIPENGRFANRPNYKDRYWKQSFFEELEKVKKICNFHKIELINASFMWLANHSLLDSKLGDSIIIGVSSTIQLTQNLESINRGTLPTELQNAFNELWSRVKDDSPEYFRYTTNI